MALWQEAVFINAGSYVIRPKSSGPVLIWRRSMARIVPREMGIEYVCSVRLSMIVRVSLGIGGIPARRFPQMNGVYPIILWVFCSICDYNEISTGASYARYWVP